MPQAHGEVSFIATHLRPAGVLTFAHSLGALMAALQGNAPGKTWKSIGRSDVNTDGSYANWVCFGLHLLPMLCFRFIKELHL